jgi:hypothetical protein
MIRVAARRSDGTKLKMDANVGSFGEAWDLLQAELKVKKIPASTLTALQFTQSKQATGGQGRPAKAPLGALRATLDIPPDRPSAPQ